MFKKIEEDLINANKLTDISESKNGISENSDNDSEL